MTDITAYPVEDDPTVTIPIIEVTNVVATSTTGLNYLNIMADTQNMAPFQLDMNRFAAAVCRLKVPSTTNLFFSTGKVVSTGSKSPLESIISTTYSAMLFQEHNAAVTVNDHKVENVVACAFVPFAINLVELNKKHNLHFIIAYDPTCFPGLTFRILVENTGIVFIIFSSGKVIITGARSKEVAEKGWRWLCLYILFPLQRTQAFQNHAPRRPVEASLNMAYFLAQKVPNNQLQFAENPEDKDYVDLVELVHKNLGPIDHLQRAWNAKKRPGTSI